MFAALKVKLKLQRFFVGEGPQQTPYLLTQRRVYILPTKQGFAFAFLLFIMLLGSINYSNSLGYFLTFLLASLSVVTIFHTYNNLLKLSFGGVVCKPSFAGDEASFTVQVNNRHHPTRFSVQSFTPQKIISIADITANSMSTLSIKHRFKQRGLIALPRFTVESRFPFGLFRTWAIFQTDQKQLVYPKPSSHKQLPIKQAGLFEGKKPLDIGSDDFRGLRSFTEGDPLQHVHWKGFARHQILQTKEFSFASANELWLNWKDTNSSNNEQKLSQLCRWLLLADKAQLRYGLNLPTKVIQPNTGKSHLASCLKQLALYDLPDNSK